MQNFETKINYESIIPKYILEDVKQRILKQYDEIDERNVNPQLIDVYAKLFQSDDIVKQHYGLVAIRKLISTNQNPIDITQSIIENNLVPILIQILDQNSNQLFIFEAIWILTNIASGTNQQTQVVVKYGGIPTILKHLNSIHLSIIEQVCWALGNIAADDGEYRSQIIGQGGLQRFIEISQQLQLRNNKSLIKLCSWTISNLCRGNPNRLIEKYKKQLIKYFSSIIDQFDDNETLTDTCWALQYISNSNQGLDPQQEIINTGMVPKLISLLTTNQINPIIFPCVRIIGNILTGSETQTDYVLNLNILDVFADLMKSTKLKSLTREICWCISNITAGSVQQIKKVLDNNNIMNLMFTVFQSAIPEIQTEIAWVFANATNKIKPQDTMRLVEMGTLEIFATTLKLQRTQPKQKQDILKSLDTIFINLSQLYGTQKEYIIDFFNIHDKIQQYELENQDRREINFEQEYFDRWKQQIEN
ncbi:unnamed protein product [Paramecium octaurelia]|uniref:Importin subunit alpha n=1 Tax=Paramecium octaurelia TaxID=43137 RepID=A0A8S1V6F6_PAROT|nr:unnamed protein product [Paramecium octaurelia]